MAHDSGGPESDSVSGQRRRVLCHSNPTSGLATIGRGYVVGASSPRLCSGVGKSGCSRRAHDSEIAGSNPVPAMRRRRGARQVPNVGVYRSYGLFRTGSDSSSVTVSGGESGSETLGTTPIVPFVMDDLVIDLHALSDGASGLCVRVASAHEDGIPGTIATVSGGVVWMCGVRFPGDVGAVGRRVAANIRVTSRSHSQPSA